LHISCIETDRPPRFRWVALQLESLKKLRKGDVDAVRKLLQSLPKDLDETYDRILLKIREEDYEYAFKVLQCLAVSAYPLTLAEVVEVVSLDFDSGHFDQGPDDALDILEICSSLVTISHDGSSKQLRGKCRNNDKRECQLKIEQEC
jgi:hypothetical protein